MKQKYNLVDWLDGKVDDEAVKNTKGFDTLKKIKMYSAHFQKPEFKKDEVYKAIKKKKNSRRKTKFNWSIAASTLLIIGVSTLVYTLSNKDFTSKINSQETVLLPDDSKVILAQNSKFQFNNWFWSFDRSTTLFGKAYFDVAKGKTFTVKTDLGTVQVLGTRFDIESRDSIFRVVCYEGSVKVTSLENEIILEKDEFVAFQNGRKVEQSNVYIDEPDWISTANVFKDSPLSEVILQLEKDYTIEIDISKLNQNKRFTGSLPSDSLSLALDILVKTYQINFKIINRNKFIFVDDETQ
ncbi:FecR family protein [Psychroflexus sp. MES1-P1E]|uniref:FecR family protein n=1 Tax=Psychroflexus sp. MES1-P1E TaxID=2058320 RepID=UPI000C798749|nr:FecR family protein [Psychroflexus sp. MES1-P1E]PKG42364.1 iron dicitrate transport regulator FecR [Psychroflexus sp. MES1-P1E]